ncbi:MAG: FAD-dependent oxidoreductase [Solobacterium sp.]|nr:FAD-dependent oxidoreductase [Solobacterium sp.]MCH4265608.1 FAD-dependent oxidoreductase [Solobacterium sp.]
MKKAVNGILSALMVLSMAGCSSTSSASDGKFKAGTYTGTGKGNNGDITVEVTLSSDAITDVKITAQNETAGISDDAITNIPKEIIDAQSVNVDTVSGATHSSEGIIEAVTNALESAGVDVSTLGAAATHENVAVTFTAGTYTGTGAGYNGDVVLDVTFSDNAITDIAVNSSKETEHVGTVAYDYLFDDIKNASGTGVDSISGATFTSSGVKKAVNDAAEQAKVSDLDGFKTNTITYTAADPIEDSWDIVIVGAGGAGIAAAAQAAQDGNTVLLIEKNAEIGGNTLVSGGQYQSVMPYLVWDSTDPNATTGVGYDGNTYNKVKSVQGCIDELRTILNWDEKEFDADYYKTNEFVAGDIEELSKHGVHAEYLSTLQALKKEIQAYLDWADPQLKAGTPESELTLFSTLNLHIFQTYYGGLRPNADMTEWNYGNYDLVSQFITDGQDLKPWLEAQGSTFVEDTQPTLIGALWYRENQFVGANVDTDGDGVTEEYQGRWGTYFVAPRQTMLNADEHNEIMLRTTADSLITDASGSVTGVKATRYDGTEVTAKANKGVIISTGGYAANLEEVCDTNVYWSSDYLSTSTKTTNRSSLQGDGITMGEDAGATVTGMGWTQMMPISWIDDGNLAFGGGDYAVYINPTTGKRFVNETSERDVLSLAEFKNGIEVNGVKGVFLEIANAESKIPGPYLYGDEDVEMRQYVRTVDELADLFTEMGMPTDAATVRETIESYDKAVMAGEQPADVAKSTASRLIGSAEQNADGSYNADTYTLDGVNLRVRVMAPSTHHTMGGLSVDTERHCLDSNGNIIKGLYAAGEVTGGIHGGNRLGGNAIVEIFVSGRTAAKAVNADN